VIEHLDGTTVDGDYVKRARLHQGTIFAKFQAEGRAPPVWKSIQHPVLEEHAQLEVSGACLGPVMPDSDIANTRSNLTIDRPRPEVSEQPLHETSHHTSATKLPADSRQINCSSPKNVPLRQLKPVHLRRRRRYSTSAVRRRGT